MPFQKLLVVDFDYFFADKLGSSDPYSLLYDWGHRESPLFIEALWPGRAAAFLRNRMELPGTTGEEVGFWNRFSFEPDAKLYFGESNASAVHTELCNRDAWTTQVWLYDAHHDSGYQQHETVRSLVDRGRWSCENWMVLYSHLRSKLHVRYPRWKTWAFEVEPKPLVRVDRRFDDGEPPRNGKSPISFDRIYVCRSGAWVPSWLDGKFEKFLADCPISDQTCLDGTLPPREFSMEQVRAEIAQMEEAFAVSTHQAVGG